MTRLFPIAPVLALALFALGALAPSHAPAQTLGNVVVLDVVEGGRTERGTVMAALRLRLAPGWKTYWRAPGDAGIPPQISWQGSRNIRAVAVHWPAPEVFTQYGLRSVGYEDQLVLPVEITPKDAAAPVHMKGRMDIGVCEDVCLPSTLHFDDPVSPDAARSPVIAAAMASRPFSAAQAGVTTATCTLRPVNNGLELTARITMPSAGTPEEAVVEPGNPEIWASDPDTSRAGDVLTLTSTLIHVDGGTFALDRSALRFTVLGDRHAVDIRGCTSG